MGAGPWPLLTLLFRMIPRFPPTRGARECATPTTPAAHAGISRIGPQRCGPTDTTLIPENYFHREPPRPRHSQTRTLSQM